MSLPWFRMYSEFAGDPVIQSLAFEDQRHYVILLCLKCNGTLDRDVADAHRERIVLRGLGLDPVTGGEAKRRLSEVGLIDDEWQPLGWDKRQYVSDVSTERVRKHRNNKDTGNVSETFHVTDPETDQIQNRTDTEQKKSIVGQMPNVSPPEERKNGKTAEALEVLQFLNEKTGRKYRGIDGNGKPTANLKLIIDRLKTGVSVQDCFSLIARKYSDWAKDDKMWPYLRPSTLFRASNFEQYLGECTTEENRNG